MSIWQGRKKPTQKNSSLKKKGHPHHPSLCLPGGPAVPRLPRCTGRGCLGMLPVASQGHGGCVGRAQEAEEGKGRARYNRGTEQRTGRERATSLGPPRGRAPPPARPGQQGETSTPVPSLKAVGFFCCFFKHPPPPSPPFPRADTPLRCPPKPAWTLRQPSAPRRDAQPLTHYPSLHLSLPLFFLWDIYMFIAFSFKRSTT